MRILFALLVLAALGAWFGWLPLAQALARASPRGLLVYLLLTAVIVLGYTLRWRLVAGALGGSPALDRLVTARLAGDAVGSLVPSAKLAGEPVRVAMLRDAGMPAAPATAAVAMDRLLELIGNVLAVCAYVAVFSTMRSGAARGYFPSAAVAATALVALGALLFRLRRGQRPFAALYSPRARAAAPRFTTWMDGVRRVEAHLIECVREHPRALAAGVLGSIAIEALIVAQYHALLGAFGIRLELPTLLLVLLGGGIANVVPIPAGLGALEAAQVAVVGAAGGRPDIGFVVGVLVRLHTALLLALGLGCLALRGTSLARMRLTLLRADA